MHSHLYSQPFSVPLFAWSVLGHKISCECMQLKSNPWSLQRPYESFSWPDFTGRHCSDFSNRSMQIMEITDLKHFLFSLINRYFAVVFTKYFQVILCSSLVFIFLLKICWYSSDMIAFEISMLGNGRITSITVEKIMTVEGVMEDRVANDAER